MAITYVRNQETGEFELIGQGGPTTDITLSLSGKPADAAAVGNALSSYALKSHEHDGYVATDGPVFTSSVSMSRKAGTEVGYNSVALGNNATASLDFTFAIGDGVSATNYGAFAVGTDTTASGLYSYAEGYQAKALGYIAHAEGAYTEATVDYSHAEGCGTIASGVVGQHVQGTYNVKDEDSKYLHIIGNGESDSSRSNAHTVDRNGNGWFAGSVEGAAFILKSPNGTRFQITVSDSGVLSASEIIEE